MNNERNFVLNWNEFSAMTGISWLNFDFFINLNLMKKTMLGNCCWKDKFQRTDVDVRETYTQHLLEGVRMTNCILSQSLFLRLHFGKLVAGGQSCHQVISWASKISYFMSRRFNFILFCERQNEKCERLNIRIKTDKTTIFLLCCKNFTQSQFNSSLNQKLIHSCEFNYWFWLKSASKLD